MLTTNTTNSNVYDDSLTNLSWLHDMNIVKRTIPTISSHESSINNNHKNNSNHNSDDYHICNDEHWRFYRLNPQAKPVYSYSQLILLALKQSGHKKMSLQMIYEWIADNFPYFKKMEPTWQNSVRHNLSLNKCFIKVARTRKDSDAGGKGGFWTLSPDYDRYDCQIISTVKSTANIKKRPSPKKRQTKTHVTKFDESDLLLLDAATFNWDAYLDDQSLIANKTEQDLFDEFDAALTDLTTSATITDTHAFDGFDYPTNTSTYNSLFDENDQEPQFNTLSVKGHSIKRPSWWITTNETTRLPSLETAFDLKLSK